ncbi:hypothetical protein AB0I81_03100 [Nonomuraea sp. NPDC050404]|uniref:hypothetical protein n=1 Tax=Nonomuraea sp. NPDC050404 TaxID=3155783 RepID=UPI0033FC91AF
MPTITRPRRVTSAQALAVAATLGLPAVAQGAIVRRPLMVRLATLAGTDRRAIGLLRRLRAAYGDGPLLVPVPGNRSVLLPLTSHDVRAVLEDPSFTPANKEKRGALAHFEPDAVLITAERELRERRRELNERVLSGADFAPFARIVEEEAATLPRHGILTWPRFHAAHWRIVRRVVLGDGARDDVTLIRQLDLLRRDANWSYLRGRRTDVRMAFQRRLARHLARAEPGSLAGVLARTHAGSDVHAEGQVPHWLFAFDAGAMASYRALALLGSKPGATTPEPSSGSASGPASGPSSGPASGPASGPVSLSTFGGAGAVVGDQRQLRAAVLESIRLWPTTLAILRDLTVPSRWDLPEGTTAVIYSPYVNRAEPGDSYRPGLWLGAGHDAGQAAGSDDGAGTWRGVPFSAGFATCAGAELVLSTSAGLLGALLRERSVTPSVTLEDPMPAALDHFRLRFAVKAAER